MSMPPNEAVELLKFRQSRCHNTLIYLVRKWRPSIKLGFFNSLNVGNEGAPRSEARREPNSGPRPAVGRSPRLPG